MITVYVHIEGLETSLMEIEEMPTVTDTLLIGKNPRRRDGKDLPFILPDVTTIVIPLIKVLFIEVLSQEEEEDFETFIRE